MIKEQHPYEIWKCIILLCMRSMNEKKRNETTNNTNNNKKKKHELTIALPRPPPPPPKKKKKKKKNSEPTLWILIEDITKLWYTISWFILALILIILFYSVFVEKKETQ